MKNNRASGEKNNGTALSEKDCYRLFAKHGTPPHVIRHCVAVSRTAHNIASELIGAGLKLDAELIRRAGLLHDLARAEKNHAERAAEIVGRYDPAAADVIRVHMNHDISPTIKDLGESDIVSLADRSVLEDKYVGYEKRMGVIIARFADNPEAVKHLKAKLRETSEMISAIELFTGKAMADIAAGGPSAKNGGAVDIAKLLSRVTKPGRYIGGEVNSASMGGTPPDTRLTFCFPDLYEIGMSYTGLQIIYGLLNSLDGVFCERAFAPADDMEQLMRAESVPLFTLETHAPVRGADIVAFTLQYELSYTNILNMLDLAGIPITSAERMAAADMPFVCAGGSCACNPEPLAEVFDFMVVGDGEEILPEICRAHREWKRGGAPRSEFLKALAGMDGIYVPSFYSENYSVNGAFTHHEKSAGELPDRVKKLTVSDLGASYYPLAPIVPIVESAHERAVCEISRGCGRGCRFCQAGYIYRPVRKRALENITGIIEAQLDATGYDEVSLLSLSAGDHPDIEPLVAGLMDGLAQKDVALSLPSLRLDSISQDVLTRIASYKKSSLTFAPEAGTQRLRDVIRKNITEKDILSGVEKAISIGWNRVKLYFMIGLPTETREDLDGIAELAASIMALARSLQEKGRRNFGLTVSVSNFVPKPHTPFQWARGDSEETLREKMYYLKDKLRGVKGVGAKFHDTRVSAVEMMLSKGDRRTFAAIRRAWELGCRFDSWREHFDYALWTRAFEESGIPIGTDRYTDTEAPLPWDIVDTGTDRALILGEYRKALGGAAACAEVSDSTEVSAGLSAYDETNAAEASGGAEMSEAMEAPKGGTTA